MKNNTSIWTRFMKFHKLEVQGIDRGIDIDTVKF